MISKRAQNFDFFLSHLYDDISQRYNIDGDQTRQLVKFVYQTNKKSDKDILKSLKDNASEEEVHKILAYLASKDGKTEKREDSMRDFQTFVVPEGMSLRQTQHINFSPLKKGDSMKLAGPAYSIPVSEHEKALAIKVRKSFEGLLKKQDNLLKFLAIFFDHLEELQDQAGLIKISPLIKRYEHKMRRLFNEYIKEFSKALSSYENNFSDSDMDDIRDLIIENVKSMREIMIEIIYLMQNVAAKTFSEEVLSKYRTFIDLSEKLEGIIRDEWFGHIDYDILGRIRLGTEIPLSIKKEGKDGI